MDCTGLFLAELDFVLYCAGLHRTEKGGGGKGKINQCFGRPETAIDLAENLKREFIFVTHKEGGTIDLVIFENIDIDKAILKISISISIRSL